LTEIKFDHFSVLLKIRSQAPVVGAHSVDLDHMSFLFSPVGDSSHAPVVGEHWVVLDHTSFLLSPGKVGDFYSSHAPVVGEHADRVLVAHRVAGGAGAEEGLVVVARQPCQLLRKGVSCVVSSGAALPSNCAHKTRLLQILLQSRSTRRGRVEWRQLRVSRKPRGGLVAVIRQNRVSVRSGEFPWKSLWGGAQCP